MTDTTLLAYAAALSLAVATPGPATIAIISKGVAQGVRPALAAASGVAVADVLLGALALAGIAAILALFAWVFILIKFAGAFYLVWLGVKMWRTLPQIGQSAGAVGGRDFLFGLVVALGNPKAILFHASLMPLLIDLRHLDWGSAAAILAIIFAVNLAVMGSYAILAGRGAGWLRTPARLKWMNRAAGGTMVGAGVAIATR